MTIDELGQLLRARRRSALELTEDCLVRVAADGGTNAFIVVDAEGARRAARIADEELAGGRDRGPLHGVPLAVKDLFDVAALPTSAASKVRAGHVASADAAAIKNLREQGAILIGKTNLHEFGYGSSGEESAFGPVRNPHDLQRVAGGSSSGSAAAVAAGMVPAALGTDTGGSTRVPAAACGIVGLKLQHSWASMEGVVPLAPSLDHLGALATTVRDAALVCAAMSGRGMALKRGRLADERPLRLLVPRPYFFDVLDAEVRAAFQRALGLLARRGADVRDTEIGHAGIVGAAHLCMIVAEGAATHASTLETMPEKYSSPVRLRLEMGRYLPAEDYLRARRAQAVLTGEVDAALATADALLMPTMPMPAPRLGEQRLVLDGVDLPVRHLMQRLTTLFNLTGHPALSLPMGRAASGLPMGLQVACSDFDALVRVGTAVEDALAAPT